MLVRVQYTDDDGVTWWDVTYRVTGGTDVVPSAMLTGLAQAAEAQGAVVEYESGSR